MDQKALYSLSYGVFMVATKSSEIENGCITNTCIQVASNPTRLAICCLNVNYTCDLIKKSGLFTLSILDNTCTFDTIRTFGMQSGREIDKFSQISCLKDERGINYLGSQTCAVLCCHVVDKIDLGTHTMFIAEIDDSFRTSENAPLTYADYQNKLKPKPQMKSEGKKIIAWRCKICNFVYEDSELPSDFECPVCGHPASDFEPVYES